MRSPSVGEIKTGEATGTRVGIGDGVSVTRAAFDAGFAAGLVAVSVNVAVAVARGVFVIARVAVGGTRVAVKGGRVATSTTDTGARVIVCVGVGFSATVAGTNLRKSSANQNNAATAARARTLTNKITCLRFQ